MRQRLTCLVVLAALLAGCSGASPGKGADAGAPPVADAVDLRDAADHAAQGAGALRAILGSEGANASADLAPFVTNTTADPDVGDGAALAWTFVYAPDDASQLTLVAVAANGTALGVETIPASGSPVPLPSASGAVPARIASSRSVAARLAANATQQAFAASHPTARVSMVLLGDSPQGPAAWRVQRLASDGAGLAATVDAATGRILEVKEAPTPAPCCDAPTGPTMTPPQNDSHPSPPDETDRQTIALSVGSPRGGRAVAPMRHDFENEVALDVEVSGGSVTMTITDAEGVVIVSREGAGPFHENVSSDLRPPLGAPLDVEFSVGSSALGPVSVTLATRVHYTKYAPTPGRSVRAGSDLSQLQQTTSTQIPVPTSRSGAFRISFEEGAPVQGAGPNSTWRLLDASSHAIGQGSAPLGEATFSLAGVASVTLEVTGGAGATTGERYHYELVAQT